MNIQWFPGHMTKTRKQIGEDIKQVDILYELLDARLPMSSRNPEIDKIAKDRKRMIILNKCDLADPEENVKWKAFFEQMGIPAVLVSCSTGEGINDIYTVSSKILKDVTERRIAKGITGASIKAMIVGIPNVGKSTLINKLSGRAGTKTGDRPGVTKSKQWITVKNKFMLLDTPGILWPKFEDEKVGIRLAFSGAIRDEIMDVEELATYLLDYLKESYPESLAERYNIDDFYRDGYDILEDIGRKRGCMMSGGRVNTERAANLVLDEFRASKLGRITLDKTGEYNV